MRHVEVNGLRIAAVEPVILNGEQLTIKEAVGFAAGRSGSWAKYYKNRPNKSTAPLVEAVIHNPGLRTAVQSQDVAFKNGVYCLKYRLPTGRETVLNLFPDLSRRFESLFVD